MKKQGPVSKFVDVLHDAWLRRDEIIHDVRTGLRELPGRWLESDRQAKTTIIATIVFAMLFITAFVA